MANQPTDKLFDRDFKLDIALRDLHRSIKDKEWDDDFDLSLELRLYVDVEDQQKQDNLEQELKKKVDYFHYL